MIKYTYTQLGSTNPLEARASFRGVGVKGGAFAPPYQNLAPLGTYKHEVWEHARLVIPPPKVLFQRQLSPPLDT